MRRRVGSRAIAVSAVVAAAGVLETAVSRLSSKAAWCFS